MGKKNLMYLVLSGIMATGVISTAKVEVASAATTKNTKIEQKQTKKYADMQSVLKIIENNYLKQNVDGTFYIEDIAKNAIDPEIVEFVTDGMEQMNNLIKSNQLEFKMTKKGNNSN